MPAPTATASRRRAPSADRRRRAALPSTLHRARSVHTAAPVSSADLALLPPGPSSSPRPTRSALRSLRSHPSPTHATAPITTPAALHAKLRQRALDAIDDIPQRFYVLPTTPVSARSAASSAPPSPPPGSSPRSASSPSSTAGDPASEEGNPSSPVQTTSNPHSTITPEHLSNTPDVSPLRNDPEKWSLLSRLPHLASAYCAATLAPPRQRTRATSSSVSSSDSSRSHTSRPSVCPVPTCGSFHTFHTPLWRRLFPFTALRPTAPHASPGRLGRFEVGASPSVVLAILTRAVRAERGMSVIESSSDQLLVRATVQTRRGLRSVVVAINPRPSREGSVVRLRLCENGSDGVGAEMLAAIFRTLQNGFWNTCRAM